MSKFWGLTVASGKKFKQQVPDAFCVSGAALEPIDLGSGKYDENPVHLYIQQDNNDHLLCSLSPKQSILQVSLNVRIGSGETVGFHLKGGSPKSKIHLTGFTLPQNNGDPSTPTDLPFKGQRKSILVTQPKSDDKGKKRVSIVETEPYGERELTSSDDDDEVDEDDINELRKKLFNGDSLHEQEDDDDDEDDDNSDSDLNEDELKELQQLKQKGKYNPKTGEKIDESDDSDLELLDDDDEEEEESDDDEDSDSDADVEIQGITSKLEKTNQKQQKQQEAKKSQSSSPNSTSTPNQQVNRKDNKNKSLTPGTPKTLENQHLKLTPSSAGHTPMKAFSKGGVLVNEVRVGNGQAAKPGRMVTVYYSGRLKSNNKQFDSAQSGPGFKFRLGKGEVIRGWDLGVEGMKVGGKRRLTIPAQLAYGKKGAPPDIPPNSTLVFDVELKNVN